jgi:hypothetical protein
VTIEVQRALRAAIDAARKAEVEALREAATLARSQACKDTVGAAMAKCATARAHKNQLVRHLIGAVEDERPLA